MKRAREDEAGEEPGSDGAAQNGKEGAALPGFAYADVDDDDDYEEVEPQGTPRTLSSTTRRRRDTEIRRDCPYLDTVNRQLPIRRIKDVEISVPIAYGTIAYWLGKKADEYRSHRWTVYIRSISNEDLGSVIKRVIFTLHPSFPNPTRLVESAPFELTEVGWGEFEIGITVVFHGDAAEKPIELYHHLKLYPDDDAGPPSMKKPVVVETYDEIVFSEPSEAFVQRVRNLPSVIINGSLKDLPPAAPVDISAERKRGDTKEHPQVQWFLKHSDLDELARLKSARQQVQSQIMKLKRDLNLLETEASQLKASAVHHLKT